MISQRQIRSWLPTAIELFNKYMSGLNTEAVLFPIISPKTAKKERNQLVKELDSPQTERSSSAMLEFMFGTNGTAVLIGQQYIKDEHQFQKLLWHELGHAYAYQFECSGSHMIDTTIPAHAALWDSTDFSHGYIFWKEFIAESISCYVSSKIYPVGDISENWYSYKNLLENYLSMALNYYTMTIDESALSMYFSHMLMGAGEKQFFDKALNGGLQVMDYHHFSLGIDHRPSKPDEIDPYCLRLLCPPDKIIGNQQLSCQKAGNHEQYREILAEIRDFLYLQMNKQDFWSITPKWIAELGVFINHMMEIKIQSLVAILQS